jgi:hypothetical protein
METVYYHTSFSQAETSQTGSLPSNRRQSISRDLPRSAALRGQLTHRCILEPLATAFTELPKAVCRLYPALPALSNGVQKAAPDVPVWSRERISPLSLTPLPFSGLSDSALGHNQEGVRKHQGSGRGMESSRRHSSGLHRSALGIIKSGPGKGTVCQHAETPAASPCADCRCLCQKPEIVTT